MTTAQQGKRSPDHGIAEPQPGGPGQTDHPGGSAELAGVAGGGGGYLDGCTSTGPSSGVDPRLGELAGLGLDVRWLAVAHRIGVDAFLAAWQTLDEHSEEPRVCVPRFRAWRRLQRNKAILWWHVLGTDKREIRRRIRRQYRESLSERHIDRIIAAGNIAP